MRALMTWAALLVTTAYALAQPGPLTNAANLRVRTDSNGYFLVAAQTYTAPDGPLSVWANTRVRTDANGYLIVTNPSGLGAPTNTEYWVGAADATLTAEHNLGALSTALVLNTTGTPSAYGGTSCTPGNFVQALSATGSATCATPSGVTSHDLLDGSVHPDTAASTVVLGDIIHGNATPKWARLAGNTTTTRKFLRQTGTGSASAVPAWDTILAADVPGSALTKTDDTNVTLTLGGSPTTALLNAASITAGWTGQLGVSRGGTGLSTFGGTNTLLYTTAAGALASDTKLTWDSTGRGFVINNVVTPLTSGRLEIQGASAGASTDFFLRGRHGGDGSVMVSLREDGRILGKQLRIEGQVFLDGVIEPLTSTTSINIKSFNAAGGQLTVGSSTVGSWDITRTSGRASGIEVLNTFAPTSGNATFAGVRIAPTINQTGSASGNYAGLLLDVTETSALGTGNLLADFRLGGTPRFSVGTAGEIAGALYRIEVNTASKTPGAGESRECYTNTGDTDGSTITLPDDPATGYTVCSIATVAQTITISPNTGETIRDDGATCASVSLGAAIGESLILVAATGGNGAMWVPLSSHGGFTCTP